MAVDRKSKKNIIYVFTISRLKDNGKKLVKVGETSKNSDEKILPRINNQIRGLPIIDKDDTIQEELRFPSSFKDKQIHEQLVKMGFKQYKNVNGKPTEWFDCTPEDAIIADLILSGYPVEHWSTKEKESLYEFKRILEELKGEHDARNIKEQVKDLKEIIQDIRVFYYDDFEANGLDITFKDIKNFPQVLKTFEKKCGLDLWQIVHILYNLQLFRNENETMKVIKKFKENINELSSSEIELFLKLLVGYKDGFFKWKVSGSLVEVMDEIFDYFRRLQNEGCNSYLDLQERLKKLRKLEESEDIIKNIREVTANTILEKMIPEELYSIDYFKNKKCYYKKHYGERWLEVLKKDRGYITWLVRQNLKDISEYVSLLRIDEKELDNIIEEYNKINNTNKNNFLGTSKSCKDDYVDYVEDFEDIFESVIY